MKTFLFRFTLLFTCIGLLFTSLAAGANSAGSAFKAEDPDAVLLNAVIVSDLHAANALSHDRNKALTRLFAGIDKSKTPPDALVLPGDLTNNGGLDEYRCLAAILKRYNHADSLIAAIGNHDARGDMNAEDYAENMANYYTFCAAMDIKTDKPYWSEVVKGYSFIVLGSEDEVKDRAYISEEQLAWLDAQLTEAEQNGKLAFVICHQVIDHTNNVDWWWYFDGSVGEQSDAVRDVIRSHTDRGLTVLFLSGHLHRCFCADSFEQPWPNLYCLNVPTVQDDNVQINDARPDAGEGCTIEVYADRVLIRPRNFITGEWLDFEYSIPLN